MAKGRKKLSKDDDDIIDVDQFCVAASCEGWMMYKQRSPEQWAGSRKSKCFDFSVCMHNPNKIEEYRRCHERSIRTKPFTCFLWNPTSRKKINLPNIIGWFLHGKCILTAPPTSPECCVFFLIKNKFMFLFCRPRDTKWTEWRYHNSLFQDAILYNKKLYVLSWDKLCEAVINSSKDFCFESYVTAILPRNSTLSKEYLVESGGELLAVQKKSIFDVAVFKMDFSQHRWERVFSIGNDRIICLIGDHAASFSSVELGMFGSGNTIFISEEGDNQTLYSFTLSNKCLSPFKNHPNNDIWVSHDQLMPSLNVPNQSPRCYDPNILEQEGASDAAIREGVDYMYNDENQSESKWFRLPIEVQQLIYQHLSSVYECMNFKAVCKAWRSLVHPIKWKSNFMGDPMKYPLFMFPQSKKGIYSLYDPIGSSMHSIKILELEDCEVRYSNLGWLLVTKAHTSIFFMEPFTRERFQLPDLRNDVSYDGFCFTNAPTLPHWKIFGLSFYREHDSLFLSHLKSGDEGWFYRTIRSEYVPSSCYTNPVFDGQHLWYMGKDGSLVFIESITDTEFILRNEVKSSSSFSGYSRSFLVCDENELLSVFLDQIGKSVHVFKLDRKQHTWVRIKSLEKKILYLSKTTCLVVQDMDQRKSNTIQFSMFSDIHGNGGNISYSLKNEKYHDDAQVFSSITDLYDTKEFLSGTWIHPLVLPEMATVV